MPKASRSNDYLTIAPSLTSLSQKLCTLDLSQCCIWLMLYCNYCYENHNTTLKNQLPRPFRAYTHIQHRLLRKQHTLTQQLTRCFCIEIKLAKLAWEAKMCSPRRGIEPRSPAWQAGILTTRLPRTRRRLAVFLGRFEPFLNKFSQNWWFFDHVALLLFSWSIMIHSGVKSCMGNRGQSGGKSFCSTLSSLRKRERGKVCRKITSSLVFFVYEKN